MLTVELRESSAGKKYVSVIENELIPELKRHGYDTDTMQDYDLRELAKNVAAVAKNKITHSTTFFGSSIITVDNLSQNINAIVQGVLDGDYLNSSVNNSDTNIPLTPFMPSMNLRGPEYV